MARWERRTRIIALLVSLVLLSVLMSLTARERERLHILEQVVIEAVTPVQAFAYGIVQDINGFVMEIKHMRELEVTNRDLSRRVALLIKENNALREEVGRLERLSEFGQYGDDNPGSELVLAEVIGRDPGDWWTSITINRGSNHGIRAKQTVLTPKGLIGHVMDTTPNTARVMLLLDPRSGVSARVQRSREVGIIEGNINSREELRLINLPERADIRVGDQIVTSGLGPVYPKGILIGTVVNISSEHYGLLKEAKVIPSADFGRLEEVFVLTGTEEGE